MAIGHIQNQDNNDLFHFNHFLVIDVQKQCTPTILSYCRDTSHISEGHSALQRTFLTINTCSNQMTVTFFQNIPKGDQVHIKGNIFSDSRRKFHPWIMKSLLMGPLTSRR